ncbi:Fe-S cluster assembly protein SufD [Alkalihalobacillus pseudalcaliphilus]|uniref:Fe-S cluster assembly protein SufD n=1 Tax=Alkalihalobacillus pseudalcaliphilus TaxID=79884 RepID=UPI00064D9B65|nr:Fe-S cluster assembly protein SufD [Alkalihalobacillus pseudalcaliphilus]KMK77592.1 Fe-S cluster assembly protein SufD [Alkalihalobacillus pseudalcaliphilus]
MSIETTLTFGKEQIQAFSDERKEPKWFQDIRLQGLELIDSLELPKPDKTKIAKWNFTEFTRELSKQEAVSSFDGLSGELSHLVDASSENVIVQQDGQTIFSKVNEDINNQGVIFTDIQTALVEHSDLVEKFLFGEAVHINENKLTALHAALMNGGLFVYVPKNVQVEVPLQAVYSLNSENGGLFNHVIVVAEANSSVTYVENYVSPDVKKAVVNVITEVYAEDGAKVSFGAVDHLSEDVTTYVVRRAHVNGRNARVEWALGQMNNGNTVSENTTHLIGEGSTGDAKTVSVGTGSQKQNFTTSIIHHGKHSDGQILKHGVMLDNATMIFNGIGKIEHGATKSNAEQTERVLMLSEKARGDANPILLIDEDDVTAGHAASVGRIDPIQMFYLMSRGIPRKEAERLVIHGFLAPVVEELPIASVKERLREAIERKVK